MRSINNRVLVLVCAAGFALACEAQEPATEQGSETSPAADATAAQEAIEAKDRAWEAAATAGDAAARSAVYTENAIVLPPGAARVEGGPAVQEMWAAWLAEAGISSASLNSDVITVASSGDIAHAVGSYTLSGTGADGAEWTDTGKYVTLWENVDGDWLIAADIWNSDAAPEGMESETMTEEPEAAPAE